MLHATHDATRQERQLRIGPTMMHDPLTSPADAYSPDADRAGPDAPARLPEWVVHLLAVVIHFILSRMLAAHGRRSPLPSWWQDRPDLPPVSAQALAAAVRGPFGNAIAWMCLRRGFGPGHPDWPYLSRTIVAFGGSVKRFRAGARPYGLQWWENPDVTPGTIGETRATPAADAMALLLSREGDAQALPPALHEVPAAAAPAVAPAPPRPIFARAATGPPTGPPVGRDRQLCYAFPTGPVHGWPRHPDSCRRQPAPANARAPGNRRLLPTRHAAEFVASF